jgi:hypothetical protein
VQGRIDHYLPICSDAANLRGRLRRLTLIGSHNSFTHSAVDAIQVLHYRSLVHSGVGRLAEEAQPQLIHQSHADIVLSAFRADKNVSKVVIQGMTDPQFVFKKLTMCVL